MGDIEEKLASEFNFLNVNISKEVLQKCVEICNKYNVDSEDFVNEWMAYTASFLWGEPPSVKALETMERKVYMKDKNKTNKKPVTTPKRTTPAPDLQDHNVSHSKVLLDAKQVDDGSLKVDKNGGTQSSAESQVPKKIVSISASQHVHESGKILCLYNCNREKIATFKRTGNLTLNISLYEKSKMIADIHYMYDILRQKAEVIDTIIEELGHALIQKYFLKDIKPFVNRTAGIITTYGRICYNEMDGKPNEDNLILEGSISYTKGQSVRLDISRLRNYSLFPGEVVALKGANTGKAFIPQIIYSDLTLPLPESALQISENETLQIVVAAGPFTTTDNISYEPLEKLIKYVKEYKPHVLVLIGPFLDDAHVENFVISKPVEEFFEDIIKNVTQSLEGLGIQIVLIPSLDVNRPLIYPTPPYPLDGKMKDVHCFPDPSLINISGLICGATSADILFDLSKQELSSQSEENIGRVISYILSQRSFYPLCPPADDMSVDYSLLHKYGNFSVTPHILYLPSKLPEFIKVVSGCLVINPGYLSRDNMPGTFGRIEITGGRSNYILENAICEVVNI